MRRLTFQGHIVALIESYQFSAGSRPFSLRLISWWQGRRWMHPSLKTKDANDANLSPFLDQKKYKVNKDMQDQVWQGKM